MTDSSNINTDLHHLNARTLTRDDFKSVKELTADVYPELGAWKKHEYDFLIDSFPEGQLCIEDNGKIVAAAFAIIVDYSKWNDRHTYEQITDNCRFTTHDKDGDTLYGVDVFVHQDFRGLRLGRRLYDMRKEICHNLNLRAIIAGGRIPGYGAHADQYKPQQYVQKVKDREIYDPILTFQLANGFHIRRVVKNYLRDDQASRGYATLLEWLNIYYEDETEKEDRKIFVRETSKVRVGLVQWQMSRLDSLESFLEQIEYFVDAVSDYESDVILFPEFVNGALLEPYNDLPSHEAVRELANITDTVRQKMVDLAISYNINIIGGSLPEYKNGELRNVAYLCRRDGSWDQQYKIHATPFERERWGMKEGDDVRIFETDFGRIGILICYDVEFPELGRILGEQDMDILFVPFWTDTKNAYHRVRYCAQARAIENECYVVLTGSTGNLPVVKNMDIQYSQSAILTPSDFMFPHDCIAAEATPNTEMTLIADLDLDDLTELHEKGAVRNMKDRRHDLYEIKVKSKKPIEKS